MSQWALKGYGGPVGITGGEDLLLHVRGDIGTFEDAAGTDACEDADVLAEWQDLAVSPDNLEQDGAGSQPTWQAAELNGLGVAQFDGGDFMEGNFAGKLRDMFDTYTLQAVANPTNFTAARALIGTEDMARADIFVQIQITDGFVRVYSGAEDAYATASTTALTAGSYKILTIQNEPGVNLRYYVNNVAAGTATAQDYTTAPRPDDTSYRLGGQAGGNGFLGFIAEHLLYKVILNSVQLATNQSTLANRWGL